MSVVTTSIFYFIDPDEDERQAKAREAAGGGGGGVQKMGGGHGGAAGARLCDRLCFVGTERWCGSEVVPTTGSSAATGELAVTVRAACESGFQA